MSKQQYHITAGVVILVTVHSDTLIAAVDGFIIIVEASINKVEAQYTSSAAQ